MSIKRYMKSAIAAIGLMSLALVPSSASAESNCRLDTITNQAQWELVEQYGSDDDKASYHTPNEVAMVQRFFREELQMTDGNNGPVTDIFVLIHPAGDRVVLAYFNEECYVSHRAVPVPLFLQMNAWLYTGV